METGTERVNLGMARAELIIKRLEMVEKGSCKECLYCEASDPATRVIVGRWAVQDEDSHFCAMQVTAVREEEELGTEWFSERVLEQGGYPMLDTCVWDLSEDCCFSFMPQNGVEAPEPAEHRKYMDDLVKLINDADLTELGFLAKECQPRGGKMPTYLWDAEGNPVPEGKTSGQNVPVFSTGTSAQNEGKLTTASHGGDRIKGYNVTIDKGVMR